jgi:glycosyltransferase involved in cell wall biosynthesis
MTVAIEEGGRRTRGIAKRSEPDRPLITVIMPTFNIADTLDRAIQSVLEQSYDNVELVILDGGSTDGTVDILRKHEDSIDYWRSQPDDGIYDAMNQGVDLARGSWLFFMGGDDVLVNNLRRVVPKLRSNKCIYYGDAYWPTRNRVYDGKFTWVKLTDRNICHQAIFYPAHVFDSYRYDIAYGVTADYDLNIKAWADGRFKFCYIGELVSIFNDAGGRSFVVTPEAFLRDKDKLIEAAFGDRMRRRGLWLRFSRPLVAGLRRVVPGLGRKRI